MGLIHHVLLTNSSGNVVSLDNGKSSSFFLSFLPTHASSIFESEKIFSKFYDNKTDEEKFNWECKVYELTREEWHLARAERSEKEKREEKNEKIIPQLAAYGDKTIVYSCVGDLIVFLTGSEEYDELIYVLMTIIESVRGFCKKGVTEAAVIEEYHKLCIYMDEIIKAGFLDVLQYEKVYSYVHMKYDQVPKK